MTTHTLHNRGNAVRFINTSEKRIQESLPSREQLARAAPAPPPIQPASFVLHSTRGSSSNERNNINNSRNSRGTSDINMHNILSMMKSYQGRTKCKGNFDEDFEGALEQFETFAQVY